MVFNISTFKISSLVQSCLILSILLIVISCKPSRYLKADEFLIDKVEVKGVDKKLEADAKSFIPRANEKIFGLKFRLGLYNTFNYKNGKYRDKPKKLGEAPAIYDSTKVVLAVNKMSRFLLNKGFFNNTVEVKVDTLGAKKIRLIFIADQGPVYTIRNYKFSIPDTALASLYLENYHKPIDSGKPYDYYLLEREVSAANNLFKRNGYKDFQKGYVRYKADTLINDSVRSATGKESHQVDITTIINNPRGVDHHIVYTMNETYVTIMPVHKRRAIKADTLKFGDVYFSDKDGRFKPKRFTNLIFFKKDSVFNNDNYLKTYTHLADLNLFKFINFDFKGTSTDSSKLNTYIQLTSALKRSVSLSGEFTLSGSYLGMNAGINYKNRNIFGGGEIFELKLKGGLEFQPTSFNGLEQPRIREKTVETGASILFPRIISPFRFSLGDYALPKTRITLGYNYEDRTNFFSTGNLYTSLSYEWRETIRKNHYLTPVNLSLVNSSINPDVLQQYVLSGKIAAVSRYDSYFSLGTQYTYVYNDYRIRFGGNFIYLKGSIDAAGNLLYMLYKALGVNKDSLGQYNTFNKPFFQYLKPDMEVRYYKLLNRNQFIARLNVGIGFAYGNSSAMPYTKLYGAGGANSLRAWRARQVGPGAFPRNDIRPTDILNELRLSLEQLGEMKIEANLEYRFPIFPNFLGFKLDGATFLEAGNVWNIKDLAFLYPQGQFKFDSFYKELAIGTGAGIRMDLSFLVLRLDAGLKLHDPQFATDRWVIKHLGSKNFKNQYPNFRFINYSIGIGYPF